jgi:hypothetical protein
MIIEELVRLKNGTIKKTQSVLCMCEHCKKKFRKTYFLITKIETLCRSCATTNYNKTRDSEIHKKMISNAANTWKGKTRIQVCGIEKANSASKSQSVKTSGKNNPNFGGKYSRGFADRPPTGPIEIRYGKEKADIIKAKMSLSRSGKNNPMYGKPSPAGSGNGISGWWKQELYFRSLLELAFILKCEKENKIIKSAEKKEFRFNYEIDGKARTYVPDFVDEVGNLYELKPKKLLNSYQVKLKMAAAPNVIVLTEDDVTRPIKEELLKLIENGFVKIDSSKMRRVK